MEIKRLISELTMEEKIALVAGTDFMYTNPVPRLGIKSLRMSDGPHGLRVQTEGGDNGVTGSLPATAFPTAATVASGWNPDNSYKIGKCIGKKARKYGILFGNSSPCGRLAETWPMKYSDVPFGESFAESKNEVYKESVYVGYRYYTTADIKVRYPFGYGLSYTEFKYLNIGFEDDKDVITVSGEILNTGRYRGAEVVQLYVKSPKNGGVFKPARELRAFTKVYLEPNERKKFELKAEKKSLGYFDVKKNAWVTDGGEYELQLCADCNTVYKSYTFKMDGEISSSPYEEETAEAYMNADLSSVNDVLFEKLSGQKIPPIQPCKPITLESRFTDLNSTFMGRILYNAVLGVANKQMKDAEKMQEGSEKDNKLKGAQFLKRILESNSLISMSMSAGNSFPYNFAQGFMHFANGHFIKGIKSFCQKIKAPTLPKDKKQ